MSFLSNIITYLSSSETSVQSSVSFLFCSVPTSNVMGGRRCSLPPQPPPAKTFYPLLLGFPSSPSFFWSPIFYPPLVLADPFALALQALRVSHPMEGDRSLLWPRDFTEEVGKRGRFACSFLLKKWVERKHFGWVDCFWICGYCFCCPHSKHMVKPASSLELARKHDPMHPT